LIQHKTETHNTHAENHENDHRDAQHGKRRRTEVVDVIEQRHAWLHDCKVRACNNHGSDHVWSVLPSLCEPSERERIHCVSASQRMNKRQ